ncbi:MAG TPA: glycoside hydrolase family 127 protein [Anaerohalosphaeraceae bacterium]|nr:glycoside hydrolase family 127 protein [Anaerohalosphaeraceae bacterium]HOM75187.1 glycoside hydrolase family 127 protein [Anaerohalosphaeraceae bacterium]HPC63568.1 glycoside hydrolase family 127 protein [Anaerohalosphaeraceae bacterium]HPO69686.1 glycoside hydrolase family 127 protein [Anaerohalosphaeraceae bacterium]HRS70637.1 glycoside hydrolase family 127 protein [Anaerohalosphaeraceae bacterium]
MNKLWFIHTLCAAVYLNVYAIGAADKIRPHVKLTDTGIEDVKWTEGFWADRFRVCHEVMIPNMWDLLKDAGISHAYANFLVAAGLQEGRHRGPKWHDGDFYKWLEAAAFVYAVTKDEKLNRLMDEIIDVIGKAQRKDGYIHTPVIIAEKQSEQNTEFQNRMDFETYNMGHLMTCAAMHYKATGKKTLLEIACRSADYLCTVYQTRPENLANNAICPSHYMGLCDLYRVTGQLKYLELAQNLIDIRWMVKEGSDDNQDRIPFYQQREAVGHAVRANYLYAGAADIFAETGNDSLWKPLESIWRDIVTRKMYVNGATGALYDGASPDGSKDHHSIQLVHQAYGRAYQLPNLTAYNETCATIGFVLFNKRMLDITADARYADILELAFYNGILSTISLDGKEFFYTNPLRVVQDEPFEMRWSRQRQPYISCFCCPPNTVRMIAESARYAYSISEAGLYVHLYGSNTLDTQLADGSPIKLRQQTNYPWEETIQITMEKAPAYQTALFLRIPGWAKEARVEINGKPAGEMPKPESYFQIQRRWAAGDQVRLVLPMPVQFIEANPFVEEARNQTAVKRGPIVYCLESADLMDNVKPMDIAIGRKQKLTSRFDPSLLGGVVVLEGIAMQRIGQPWQDVLYREISEQDPRPLNIRLIPYYAWGNRGKGEMTVWMPIY